MRSVLESHRLIVPLAETRVALRRARSRLAGRRARPSPPRAAGDAVIRTLPAESAAVAARAAGIPADQVRRGLRTGEVAAYSVRVPGRPAAELLCRTDRGTATVDLVPLIGPRGRADPDAVAVLAAALLASDGALRRVAHASPPAAGIGPALIAAGFVDEGWAPPPAGGPLPEDGGDWRLYTLLRELTGSTGRV